MTSPASLETSPKYITVAAIGADDDAIKTSIATVAGTVTYSGVQLNGAMGAGNIGPTGRKLTVTTTTHTATYNIADPIVITGTDMDGNVQTESITLTLADGNETKTGAKYFGSVTSIAIPAQADTLGTFKFGIAAGVRMPFCRQIRTGGAGDLYVTAADGVTTLIPSAVAGERFDISAVAITSSTTATNMTIFF